MDSDKREVGNSNFLKRLNRSEVLSLIFENGSISRGDLKKYSGLNQSTISRIVDEFIKSGLICEYCKDESAPMGRKPSSLSINKEGKIVGVIVIDPILTSIAVCDIVGSVLSHIKVKTVQNDPEGFLRMCASKLREVMKPIKAELLGVGVTSPGKVNSAEGIIYENPFMKWPNVNVVEVLKSEFNCKIMIENDAKAGAIAQLCFAREARDISNFILVLIDYGIWGGIILNKALFAGCNGLAGQFGSMLIPIDEGENGNYITAELDSLASEMAIVRRYKGLSKMSLVEDIDQSMRLLVFNCRNGEKEALKAITESAFYLGRSLALINNIFTPERIFVAGKITQLWDIMLPAISEQFEKFSECQYVSAKEVIVPSSLVWASFEGASAMVLQDYFSMYKVVYRHPTWSNWAQWR